MEKIIYKGTIYRRYPMSNRHTDREYYRSSGWGGKPLLLHREIWKDTFGAIPEGHHVHHKDGDTSNNALSNLECIPSSEHYAAHREERRARGKSEKHLALLEKIRPLTKEWHASKDGIKWHKDHYQKSLGDKRKAVPTKCIECGVAFMVDALCFARTKFCGGTCRARDLRRRYRAIGRPLSRGKSGAGL